MPPTVLDAAQGLRYAVHGFTLKDCYLFVLASVLVFPRADDEQTVCGTEVEAFCGGVITVGEAVVVDNNRGETTIRTFIHDFALARRDAGADEDGTLCRLIQAASLLLAKTLRVLAMAHHRQAAVLRQEGAVAKGVAGDEPACQQQAALYLRQRLSGSNRWRAFALQIAAKGGWGERCRVPLEAPRLLPHRL